uniref:Uncharacterized protein n=1 Tax=Solanum lycopersicum TaxID=4081 RepID=K4BGI8_SOLLC
MGTGINNKERGSQSKELQEQAREASSNNGSPIKMMNEQIGTSRLTRRSINWSSEDSISKTPLVVETSARVLTSNTVQLSAVAPMTHEQNEQLGDLQANKGKPWDITVTRGGSINKNNNNQKGNNHIQRRFRDLRKM